MSDVPNVDALTPAQTFAKAVVVGEGKANMDIRKAFVLAVLAGIFIGLGATFMLLVKSDTTLPFAVSSVLGGLTFSVGLFAVLVAGAELFTGNNLMLCALLEGKYGLARLLRSWCIVYLGNLVGSLVLVALLYGANFASLNGGAVGQAAIGVAAAKCSLPWSVALFRGILCNMLVCLAVWMGFAGRTVVDKFLAAVMPVMAFVACGFEHCVANMFFLPMGLLVLGGGASGADAAAALSLVGILGNLGAVTLGNVLGGAIMIAGAYWLAFGRKAS